MEKYSPELESLFKLLEKKAKLVAMLAPSFPVDFSYPQIVGQLKRLGFEFVVEVSRGAEETNRQLLEEIRENPKRRLVTSPCPVVTRLIRHKYPELLKFLSQAASPMANTAKLVREKYPGYKPVFIGPCPAKKFEAKEDWPELGILVLTYRELKTLFDLKGIKEEKEDSLAFFDLVGPKTRLYPVSGGLAQSSGLTASLADEEFDVISGPELVETILSSFWKNKRLKLLDILFCEGGCINGQGILSDLPIEERRQKIINLWT